MNIRLLQMKDNSSIEKVIRDCLIEFGGNRAGLAWEDDSLHHLSDYYNNSENRAYWVIEEGGEVLGGCGIAPFGNDDKICELQKMYLSQSIRGNGIAKELLNTALDFAKLHYNQCYLETLQNMHAANRFYMKNGFELLDEPLAGSEHFACDAWYIKNLM
ncbi:GNAT family N-acetyltransferase [Paenibacillus sp. FSL H7-0716]|uniref:GNAT family N-acetyltransferase n=1 Tax=Paenibacillus odorifer TaxID=189426 RepID=A0AAD0KMT4_9BACL|nr:GNAT family N-acetyltransferase [Paenibacillus odorifer]AWV33693.1 GNAT family N-acetyltransferase [Paenibacillus odorifer]OME20047.1 GNAT family N-acetyltransferase [Paenibacillus odorifer]